MVMKLLERLIKELQMTNQVEFRVKKVIKKTACKLYIKCRGYGNLFNSWIDKNTLLYKMSYYLEPDDNSRNKMKVQLDLFTYAENSEVKIAAGVDTLSFAKKVYLPS